MQHPVGSIVNDATGRAELTDFGAVLTNSTAVGAFVHTITACFVTGGMFVVAISAYHLARGQHTEVFRPSMRLGLVTVLIASLGVVVTGDLQARLMTEQQPMKMTAAEALYDTVAPASFSIFTIGSLDGSEEVWSLRVPRVLSFMATGSFDGEVEGINDLQAAAEAAYGPGDYRPNIAATYWTFRLMIGFGAIAALISVLGPWFSRGGARRAVPRWFYRAALAALVTPFAANSFGWIFTEMGRQPWVVYGVLKTADGVSPSVGAATVLTSLIVFTLLYGALAVVDGVLMVRYAKAGPPPPAKAGPPTDTDEPRPLAVAY
jgi:cytochrome bd ubiquinol oxidase subunit I